MEDPFLTGGLVIMLCADDYGFSRGIGIAIRRLIEAGRISATSCMTVGSGWPAEAVLLKPLDTKVDVGLHFTLTDGTPLGPMPGLASAGRLPSLGRLTALSLGGRIDRAEIGAELDRQIDRFVEGFGRLPDFVDGHHHAHQLPGVRDAVIEGVQRRLRSAGGWLRYSAMPLADLFRHRVAVPRAAAVSLLGLGFRRRGRASGIPGNAGFRGVRTFSDKLGYARLFPRFLNGLGPCGLIMCHPGLADDTPAAADHPITAREDEYRYLMSEAFPEALRARGFRLGRLRDASSACGSKSRPARATTKP